MVTKKRRKDILTDPQQRILIVLDAFWEKHGYAPSVREILDKAKISSTSMVNYYLLQLEELGLIERDERISRTVRLSKPLADILGAGINAAEHIVQALEEIIKIPIAGRIVASAPVPIPASDFSYYDAESSVEIARSMLPEREKGEDLFALEVQGDSMIDAMVNNGDLVIIKKSNEAKNGEMVAVWLRGRDETTLKYFFKEDNRIRLQPANPTMNPIYIDDPAIVEIQGKVLMVIRQIDLLN